MGGHLWGRSGDDRMGQPPASLSMPSGSALSHLFTLRSPSTDARASSVRGTDPTGPEDGPASALSCSELREGVGPSGTGDFELSANV